MSFNCCFVCSWRETRSYKILQEQLYHNFGVFPVTHTQIIYKSDYQMTGKCSNFILSMIRLFHVSNFTPVKLI